MVANIVPRFEPEVIAAGARRYRGDHEKVATTSRGLIELHGVIIESRYDTADEMDLMVEGVSTMPVPFRGGVVRSIFCDSKAGVLELKLAPCSPGAARMIAVHIALTCRRLKGGHGGIYLREECGAELYSLEPDGWESDPEDKA